MANLTNRFDNWLKVVKSNSLDSDNILLKTALAEWVGEVCQLESWHEKNELDAF